MFPEQLAASLKDALARYKPQPKPPADPAKAKRRKQIADSMARIRAARRAAGLNAHGRPHGGIGGRPFKPRLAYKLMRVRKDGSIGSLFINRKARLPIGQWLQAGNHPTKGFAHRPAWHTMETPRAPHLGTKGRAWFQVEIADWREQQRPAAQGGKWFLSQRMRIIKRDIVAQAAIKMIKKIWESD
jgi:hypothetical protein